MANDENQKIEEDAGIREWLANEHPGFNPDGIPENPRGLGLLDGFVRQQIAAEQQANASKPDNAGAVIHAKDDNFAAEVLESQVPVLVDFYADWCGPCRAMAPHVETIANEFAGKLKVVKVNTDTSPQTFATTGFKGIPAFVIYVSGKPVASKLGSMPLSDFRQFVKAALDSVTGPSHPPLGS